MGQGKQYNTNGCRKKQKTNAVENKTCSATGISRKHISGLTVHRPQQLLTVALQIAFPRRATAERHGRIALARYANRCSLTSFRDGGGAKRRAAPFLVESVCRAAPFLPETMVLYEEGVWSDSFGKVSGRRPGPRKNPVKNPARATQESWPNSQFEILQPLVLYTCSVFTPVFSQQVYSTSGCRNLGAEGRPGFLHQGIRVPRAVGKVRPGSRPSWSQNNHQTMQK